MRMRNVQYPPTFIVSSKMNFALHLRRDCPTKMAWTRSDAYKSSSLMAAGKTIPVNPDARGLAIIITNDYRDIRSSVAADRPAPSHVKPEGTFEDGKRMQEAFEALDFDVHWKTNVTSGEFERIMYGLKNLEFETVKHFRCLVFVFSGHGEFPGKLIMQDSHLVDISENLIDPLLPGSASKIGAIPKIFIIDACRGDNQTETVTVPVTGKGSPSSETQTVAKGAHNMMQQQLPKEGNFLVTYSTLDGCEAHDYKGKVKGSLWLEILAKKIPVVNGTIDDVLSDVNQELFERCQTQEFKFQQPERLNRLNKRLYLLGDPEKDPADAGVQRPTVPVSPECHQPLNLPTNSTLRIQQLTSQKASASSSGAGAGATAVPYCQSQSFTTNTTSTSASSHSTTTTTQPAVPRSKANGGVNCCRLKKLTRPQFSYISQQISPTTRRYRCTITYVSKGQKKTVDSAYCPSKNQAAERAAKKILEQERWEDPE